MRVMFGSVWVMSIVEGRSYLGGGRLGSSWFALFALWGGLGQQFAHCLMRGADRGAGGAPPLVTMVTPHPLIPARLTSAWLLLC